MSLNEVRTDFRKSIVPATSSPAATFNDLWDCSELGFQKARNFGLGHL